jgi:hypothetical protein
MITRYFVLQGGSKELSLNIIKIATVDAWEATACQYQYKRISYYTLWSANLTTIIHN